MRYLILVAVLLTPAAVEAQYWVPHQAWGFQPQYHAPAPAFNPYFHARVRQHQMWLQQSRAQNPHFWAMQDLRMQMQDDMDRRLRQDQINRQMNPRAWWHGH